MSKGGDWKRAKKYCQKNCLFFYRRALLFKTLRAGEPKMDVMKYYQKWNSLVARTSNP